MSNNLWGLTIRNINRTYQVDNDIRSSQIKTDMKLSGMFTIK